MAQQIKHVVDGNVPAIMQKQETIWIKLQATKKAIFFHARFNSHYEEKSYKKKKHKKLEAYKKSL